MSHVTCRASGFTLIEVLIVIAIIGLLASVVLVGLGSFRSRGRDTRRIADLRATQNGLELYYTKNGKYPADENWSELEKTLRTANIGVVKISHDPSSRGSEFEYAYDTSDDLQSYVLRAQLEDGQNVALKESYHGEVVIPGISIDCTNTPTKPYYCIQF